MPLAITRRDLLRSSSFALTSSLLSHHLSAEIGQEAEATIYLNLNENAWGPSLTVGPAIEQQFCCLARYADAAATQDFAEQIAAYERVSVDQVVLGEILRPLGLWFGSQGGPGGEFLYSTPGYLALIDAASHVGGVGVPVPLNERGENDLAAIEAKVGPKTRALYLINPHNPTGTVSDDAIFKRFLRRVSQHAPVIVDEAYLEYTPDFSSRSAADLVREGANVLVFRTFDKIHGLAGLPIGYTLLSRDLAAALHTQGIGDAESLGRLNLAAASAALADTEHVAHVRAAVTEERSKWNKVLDELKLPHTDARASFVFFDAGRPQTELAVEMRRHRLEIGRTFPPYTNWARITIGLPAENEKAQQALRTILTK